MKIDIKNKNGLTVAVLDSREKLVTLQDAIDLLGNASYNDATAIIVNEENLSPDFFDLKTGIAGEILQKYSNYRMKLAIIGDFEKYSSNALQAFIIECNRGNSVFFVPNYETALEKLI